MLHVTFEDRTTALFDPCESVIVADWVSGDGEYITDANEDLACKAIKVGKYLLYRDPSAKIFDFEFLSNPNAGLRPISTSKIIAIRIIEEPICLCKE